MKLQSRNKLQLTFIAFSIVDITSTTTTEDQIDYIASACPTSLRKKATVMDASHTILRQGTNGWTVMPANPRGPTNDDGTWTSAHEAMAVCFDDEGWKWMQAFSDGVVPEVERDAWVYMLNGDVGEGVYHFEYNSINAQCHCYNSVINSVNLFLFQTTQSLGFLMKRKLGLGVGFSRDLMLCSCQKMLIPLRTFLLTHFKANRI
jgi:hypothetical protein